jgi:hypothetical protein
MPMNARIFIAAWEPKVIVFAGIDVGPCRIHRPLGPPESTLNVDINKTLTRFRNHFPPITGVLRLRVSPVF